MSNAIGRVPRYSDQQRLEAAHWFMDIHEAQDPPPEMLQRWLRWLDASEANRLAFEAVEQAWHEAPVELAAMEDTSSSMEDDENYDATVSIVQWRARQPHKPEQSFLPLLLSRKRAEVWNQHRRPILFALATAAAIGSILLSRPALDLLQRLSAPSSAEFITRTGEHRQLVLADGSKISLGARSRLSIDFTGPTREVRLASGEAFFSVHKDPRRPFRVHALGGVITAVGTAFNVRTTGDRVTVAVAEGIVDVTDARPFLSSLPPGEGRGEGISLSNERRSSHQTSPEPVRLTPGEQFAFVARSSSPALKETTLTRIDPAQSARWREGWLVYRDEPLRNVIEDVTRYTDREISIGDSVPTGLRFTGAVYKNSVVEWIEALPEVFPVAVKSNGHNLEVAALEGRLQK